GPERPPSRPRRRGDRRHSHVRDAVDGTGNLWVSDRNNDSVTAFVPGTTTAIATDTITSGLASPQGVAFDSHGNTSPFGIAFDANGIVWIRLRSRNEHADRRGRHSGTR